MAHRKPNRKRPIGVRPAYRASSPLPSWPALSKDCGYAGQNSRFEAKSCVCKYQLMRDSWPTGGFTDNTAVLASQSGRTYRIAWACQASNTSDGDNAVFSRVASVFAVLCLRGGFEAFTAPAFAQSGGSNGKPPEPQKPAADAAKEDPEEDR